MFLGVDDSDSWTGYAYWVPGGHVLWIAAYVFIGKTDRLAGLLLPKIMSVTVKHDTLVTF